MIVRFFENLLASPIWALSQWVLLQFLWIGTCTTLVAFLALQLGGRLRPHHRYAILLVAFLLLILAPVLLLQIGPRVSGGGVAINPFPTSSVSMTNSPTDEISLDSGALPSQTVGLQGIGTNDQPQGIGPW